MRALVTGANGFIGAHLVRAALAEGLEVRAFVRPRSDQRSLADLPIETAFGDLTDPSTFPPALDGVDILFHAAARYDLARAARADAQRANVDGTRQLMLAALRAQVDRIVHTSSVAAVGPPADPTKPADETQWADPTNAPGPYEASKIHSEQLVRDLVQQEGLPAVCVLPTAPIGPLDRKPTPTGRLLQDAASGRLPATLRSAGLNIVHVEDVAVGHLRAAQLGQIGERYILGHLEGNLTLHAIAQRAALAGGVRPPRWSLPTPLAYAAAVVDEFLLSRLQQQPPRATLAGVRLARRRQFFSAQRAVTELQLPQTDLDRAFRDAARWFLQSPEK